MSWLPGATTGPAGPVHSVNLGEYLIFKRRLDGEEQAKLLMYLQEKWCVTTANRDDLIREICQKRYFKDGGISKRVPRRLFKKMRAVHADALCARGEIGLGPVRYYTAVENKRIADPNEGWFIAYAVGREHSMAAALGAGQQVLVYCTTLDSNASFPGYDACVEIIDPAAFARAVSRSVAAHFGRSNELVRVEYGRCVYQHSRILSGKLDAFAEALISVGELSVDTIDVLPHKQYLIKERAHSKDAEYRFAFVMRKDVSEYTIVKCPEAAAFCRRVA